MSRNSRYFVPDIDPTIAIAQSKAFESRDLPTHSARRNRLPWISLSAVAVLVATGWVAGLVNKKTTDSVAFEVSAEAKIPPDRWR